MTTASATTKLITFCRMICGVLLLMPVLSLIGIAFLMRGSLLLLICVSTSALRGSGALYARIRHWKAATGLWLRKKWWTLNGIGRLEDEHADWWK